MSLNVIERTYEEMSEVEWTELLKSSKPGLHDIFQTKEWARVVELSYKQKPTYICVSKEDDILGGQMYFNKPIFNAFISYESQGGPVVSEDAEVCYDLILHHLLKKKCIPLYILMRPNLSSVSPITLGTMGFRRCPFFTYVLDLGQGEEHLWTHFKKNVRNGIRKEEKQKIDVIEATRLDQWLLFHRLHTVHSINRKIAPKNEVFFKAMYEYMVPKGHAKLYLSFSDNKLLGGMLMLRHHGVMTYYIGASDDSVDQSTSDILMWRAICKGIEDGINTLDLGDTWPNPESHLYSIHRFKEKWNGTLIDDDFYVKSRLYSYGRNLVLNSRPIHNCYEKLHTVGLI